MKDLLFHIHIRFHYTPPGRFCQPDLPFFAAFRRFPSFGIFIHVHSIFLYLPSLPRSPAVRKCLTAAFLI